MARRTPHIEISEDEAERRAQQHIDFYAKRGTDITRSAVGKPILVRNREKGEKKEK